MMSLVVISIISIIISGILTFFIDDILDREHKFNWFWRPIIDGIIFTTIYIILVIIMVMFI